MMNTEANRAADTATTIRLLRERGKRLAAEGKLGMDIDTMARNEGLSRYEHHVFRIAFNREVDRMYSDVK